VKSIPLYIFDLDGTLSDTSQRAHFVERPKGQRDWKAFNAAAKYDSPKHDIVAILNALYRTGAQIFIWTARGEEAYNDTLEWLMTHKVMHDKLRMRPEGDHTDDSFLKAGWYREMSSGEKQRLVAVFEDRTRMVNAWRQLGVTCLQVAPGDF
jgi:phosphoglycolate phosphatase-like HAD superfamily hydrolase